MNCALVFFESSRTCDIVAVSAVLGEITLNSIIFTGPREICEMKIGQVTERGQLVEEDEFDIANIDSDIRETITLPRTQDSQIIRLFHEMQASGFGRLVQDNAPAHVSLYTKRKMEEWQMETLDWPAGSPDLNPIDLVRGNMKTSIRKRGVRNLNELKVAIIQYWETLTPQICSNYISGIKKKMKRVIEQGGRNIRESR
ncbi:hypothetical protein RB195_017009 [Necator americanus]|uniref:Tc1-like transposase DDE domain-containing protein n=1 Tax=Necator americanus TaxID=51031 RepID=A0ABR1C6B2_NECAM